MNNIQIHDFWILTASSECCDKPWAIPSLPDSVYDILTTDDQFDISRGRPLYLKNDIWLDRRSGKKLSDMPVCDGIHFIVSPKLHKILEPHYGDSVISSTIEIRSNLYDNEIYRFLSIQQGAGQRDRSRGAALFFDKNNYNTATAKFKNAYGIYFDTSTWTGVKIFRMGPNGNQMIVTSTVAEAVIASDLVGVTITRLDLYGINDWNRYLDTGKTPLQF